MKRLLILATLGLTVACTPPKEEVQEQTKPATEVAAAPAPAPKPVDTPDAYFKRQCSACHGDSGKGDGPGAAALDPKPRDYSDAEWQASVTDEDIKKAILGGGMAVGKSPIMPGAPDLKSQPELLDGLVKKIRSYAP